MPDRAGDNPRRTFPRARRLGHALEFRAVYDTGRKRARGPLTVWARPNGLGRARLGLSVGRRAGGATTRNAIKRRLREAFRTLRPELPPGYDLVVAVRPHDVLKTGDYARLLAGAWNALHKDWAAGEARDGA